MPEHTIAENLTRLQNAKTAIGNAITAKGGTVAASDGLEEFAADIATITNQYTTGDEGKVVSGGALIAQTAYPTTITENGTYNTTENNSVTVNVPSLPTGIEMAKLTPANDSISSDDMYIINVANRTYIVGHFAIANRNPMPKFSYPSTFTPIRTKLPTDYNYFLFNNDNGGSISNTLGRTIEIDISTNSVTIQGVPYNGIYNYAIIFTID